MATIVLPCHAPVAERESAAVTGETTTKTRATSSQVVARPRDPQQAGWSDAQAQGDHGEGAS